MSAPNDDPGGGGMGTDDHHQAGKRARPSDDLGTPPPAVAQRTEAASSPTKAVSAVIASLPAELLNYVSGLTADGFKNLMAAAASRIASTVRALPRRRAAGRAAWPVAGTRQHVPRNLQLTAPGSPTRAAHPRSRLHRLSRNMPRRPAPLRRVRGRRRRAAASEVADSA